MGWILIPQSCQVNVRKGKNGETRTLLKHQKSCWINQPKSQNQMKTKTPIKNEETWVIPTYWNGFKNSEKNLVDDRVPLQGGSHASSSHESSLEPTRREDLGKHSVYIHFQKTEIARSARGPKSHGPRAEDVLAESYLVQIILVVWLQQIIKFSVKVVNLETLIDMQSWCKTWPPNGSSRIRAKQKTSQETQRSLQKVLGARIGSLKSFTLTIPWNLAKPVKMFPGIIVRQHHTDRNEWDCWESSTQIERRDICGIVAIRSGWKLVGRFHGMLYLSAKHSRSLVWWENSIRDAFWRTF